jgi:hypothetical protein
VTGASAHKQIQFPIGHGGERAYRLSRCTGFLVINSDGRRTGMVSELHYQSRLDQPDEVVVHGGILGLQRLVYPADAITEIIPSERRLILAPDAKAVPSSRLHPSPAR